MFAHAISSTIPTAVEQHQHPRLDPGADDVIDERPHANRAVLVPDRIGPFERGAHLIHLRLRLYDRHSGVQTRDHQKICGALVQFADPLVGRHHVRNPDVGGAFGANRVRELRWHDADHLVTTGSARGAPAFDVLERYHAPDDLRIGPEPAAPQAIAEECHAIAARDLVLGGECAAEGRHDAKHRKKTGGDALRHERFRLDAGFVQGEPAAGDCGHGLEHALLSRPVNVILRRDERERVRIPPIDRWAGAQVPLTNGDKAIVLVEREAAEDDGVHDGEDRRRRAHAERQHDERRHRKAPGRTKRPQGSFEVITHGDRMH